MYWIQKYVAKALTDAEKKAQVMEIAQHMLHEELKSADALGVRRFISYAGFIAPYVADFDHYRDLVLIPSAQQMQRLANHVPAMQALLQRIDILEFFPQDVLEVATGRIRKAFISSEHYSDKQIKEAGSRFYQHYQVTQATNTYAASDTALQEAELNSFMETMAQFLNQHFEKLDPVHGANAQSFQLVIPDMNQTRRLTIGEADIVCHASSTADLTLEVKADLLANTIRKQMSFENL